MMRRRTVSVTMLILLVSTLSLVLNTQPANASGTIYIRADGSVDPPTAPISSFDNVTYTFADNVNESIVVERDNIVVNGNGYTVSGTGSGRGVDLAGRSNVTVKNAVIEEFKHGIYLHGGADNTLFENNLTANTNYGILLDGASHHNIIANNVANNGGGIKLDPYSKYNNISGNNMTANNWSGIHLYASKHNCLSGNNITRNQDYGILLDGASSNITLRNNTMTENTYNFGILNPWGFSNLMNDIDTSNTVDGKPVYYWIDKRDMSVPKDAGYVALLNCTNIIVKDLTLTSNGQGVLLARTTNSTIVQNNMTDNDWGVWGSSSSRNTSIYRNNITSNDSGIYLQSSNNTISENNLTDNWYGIQLSHLSNNVVSHNSVMNCSVSLTEASNSIISHNNITGRGLFLLASSNNSISYNRITDGWEGISLDSSKDNIISHNTLASNVDCVELYYSSHRNTICHNNITDNDDGISLHYSSNNNKIFSNNIADNDYGIRLYYYSHRNEIFNNNIVNHSRYALRLSFDCSDNRFYHNNFINNTGEIDTWDAGSNIWHIGYPGGGNYWSKYEGVDYKHGSNQDESGSDGIGDMPHTMDVDNKDRYPLMKPYPWGPHDIAVVSISESKTVVGQGYPLIISAMIFNYGNNTENFNMTIYANSTIIGTISDLTVAGRNSSVIEFAWDTTGWAIGNYSISAHAVCADGEVDLSDNTLTDGWTVVTIPGDVDADGHVSLYDLTILGTAWNSRPGDPHWWADADIDGDLHVFLGDVDIVGSHWNEVAS